MLELAITRAAYDKVQAATPVILNVARHYKNDARKLEIAGLLNWDSNSLVCRLGSIDGRKYGAVNGANIETGNLVKLTVSD